jgi:hypothetical protein
MLFWNRFLGVTCKVKRKACVKITSVRPSVHLSVTLYQQLTVCPIFMKSWREFHSNKPSNKREFRENRLSDDHTAGRGVFKFSIDMCEMRHRRPPHNTIE